ncbi:hypothetical protein [Bartonella machadoae]|uniref:hypothetical protein n=1 Tax=Bartonella machadoae TaxID=2893471 RepID=UPI001F4CE4DB|nr:hypothetical protein [Bartonella machadoae]UNE53374.1 hypothetical protein LNM86_06660 [Bartonella machadoae]
MKKYELTDETISVFGRTLHRIKALRDFGYVKKSDLGGFIQKESNLSHKGDCWIFGNAQVYDNAKVYDDARVYGNAQISDYAEVAGAFVSDNAKVFGYARIYGNSVL